MLRIVLVAILLTLLAPVALSGSTGERYVWGVNVPCALDDWGSFTGASAMACFAVPAGARRVHLSVVDDAFGSAVRGEVLVDGEPRDLILCGASYGGAYLLPGDEWVAFRALVGAPFFDCGGRPTGASTGLATASFS